MYYTRAIAISALSFEEVYSVQIDYDDNNTSYVTFSKEVFLV